MAQTERPGALPDPLGLSTPVLVENSPAGDQQRRVAMRVRVLLQITDDDGTAGTAEEVAAFDKVTERPEDLGLSIAEGKALMAAVQHRTVNAQAAVWAERHRRCEACGERRRSKGSYPVTFMTLFGDVDLPSPRLLRCPCQNADGPMTLSPLCDLIPDHVAPERLYLEARWSSLVPYAAAAGLLADILPMGSGANAKTLREHTLRVAERAVERARSDLQQQVGAAFRPLHLLTFGEAFADDGIHRRLRQA